MKRTEQLLEAIENYLAQEHLPHEPAGLYDPIGYALSNGGKRIRPTLVLLACDMFGGDYTKALPVAAAIEVFHNFTLVHDDIMDNAPMRRGRPSVPKRWNNNVAILSGDAMLVYTYQLLNNVRPEILPEILNVFNTTAMQIFEGQQYDMDFETREKVPTAEYMRMIELKTAVLMSCAATIGALVGGASAEDIRKIKEYANELGLAFQLQDDLLDCYGDATLGKKIGGDILEGKKTYLMIQAMRKADDRTKRELIAIPQSDSLTEEQKISRTLEIYEQTDARHATEVQIKLHYDRALAVLDRFDIDEERVQRMRDFANDLVVRMF